MPGRDITRPRNKAARFLFLSTFVISTALLAAAWPQSGSSPNESKPNESKPAEPSSTSPTTVQQAAPSAPDKQEKTEKRLDEQGVFVIRKDVDEVLLHASVIDDKQH